MIGHTTERLLIVRDPILAIHHLLPTPTHSQCGSLFGGSGSDAVPHTATKRHAPTGRLTATAPRYRAQPALHGSAATTALASRVGVVIVAVKATITIAPTKWAARAALQPFISTVDRDIRSDRLRKLQRHLLPLRQLRRLPPPRGAQLRYDKRRRERLHRGKRQRDQKTAQCPFYPMKCGKQVTPHSSWPMEA
jgi:hypothetical protein